MIWAWVFGSAAFSLGYLVRLIQGEFRNDREERLGDAGRDLVPDPDPDLEYRYRVLVLGEADDNPVSVFAPALSVSYAELSPEELPAVTEPLPGAGK